MKFKRRQSPVGILDIGSNSVRLCVYDGDARVPVPLFNEKVVCALGKGLGSTGVLNPEGVPKAISAVGRFVALCRAMEAEHLEVLATAAVRDASDGAAFVAKLEKMFHIKIKVLSGGQEAKSAALGVICGTPDADGIVADLGGGSLELITVKNEKMGSPVTMPLGVLRLSEASGDDKVKAAEIVEQHLTQVPWLSEGKGRHLYAVGGAWRAIARICINQTHHPLTVLDNFSLETEEALRIIDLVSSQSKKSLEKIPGVSKRRLASLGLAALTLEKIIRAVQPDRLVFSIYGMREGQFFKRLPKSLAEQDPLLSVCKALAQNTARFPEHGDELMAWMAPLFASEPGHEIRLRYAACLVSDVFWNEHPDYRAEQAFLRVLRLPFMGVSHDERAFIAYTVYQRYQGSDETEHGKMAAQLLNDESLARCKIAGGALKVAHSLTGGAPNLLPLTRLSVSEDGMLLLSIPKAHSAFYAEPDRNLEKLAKAMNLKGCAVLKI